SNGSIAETALPIRISFVGVPWDNVPCTCATNDREELAPAFRRRFTAVVQPFGVPGDAAAKVELELGGAIERNALVLVDGHFIQDRIQRVHVFLPRLWFSVLPGVIAGTEAGDWADSIAIRSRNITRAGQHVIDRGDDHELATFQMR